MSYIEIFTSDEIRQIAQVCYEANRALCVTMGDHSNKPWDESPQWQRESTIAGVLQAVDPRVAILTPAMIHQKWCESKQAAGWVYGPVKDDNLKTHPCLMPYYDLPPEQRLKDTLFLAIVDAFVQHASDPLDKDVE